MDLKFGTKFIHEHPEWPNFVWDSNVLLGPLAEVRHLQGKLIGEMKALGFPAVQNSAIEALVEDVRASSEIEGENLDRNSIRSSLATHLGIEIGGATAYDHRVDGIVQVVLDATQNYETPITAARLFGWHSTLFPTGWSGLRPIRVGQWRDDSGGPMQVVSGPLGREKVHFRAPSAELMHVEMDRFMNWFETEVQLDAILISAVAHLWFITIHPFDDGNGRLARALSDMILARSERSNNRYYSMSSQILIDRNAYYDILEKTQRGDIDVTRWLLWFISCLASAITRSESTINNVKARTKFWDSIRSIEMNNRQQKILTRLLEGFEGKLTTAKWAKLAKCSHDTALRDIHDLLIKGLLQQEEAGGRSTSYSLVIR